MTSLETYSLAVGQGDFDRLAIFNKYFNPGSQQLLIDADVGSAAAVLEAGCGQGEMTQFIGEQVGQSGSVVAIDSSSEQIALVEKTLGDARNVTFHCEDFTSARLESESFDIVYCRAFLQHLREPAEALDKMVQLLRPGGRLVCEVCDVRGLRFVPEVPDSNLWQESWFGLGEALGTSYRFADHARSAMDRLSVTVTTFRINQPVSRELDAKMLHVLGFQQLIPQYLEKKVATPESIQRSLRAFQRLLDDPSIYAESYRMNQFIAVKERDSQQLSGE